MSSEEKIGQPAVAGNPYIHVLKRATDGSNSMIPMSIIPIYAHGAVPHHPGMIQIKIPISSAQSQTGRYQAANRTESKTATVELHVQEPGSTNKRKHTDDDDDNSKVSSPPYRAPHSYLMQQQTQPRTSQRSNTQNMMHIAYPKRQRVQINTDMRLEILEFCKNHTTLKQGEIAEIFGVDRTTVTKMLKRNQEMEAEARGHSMIIVNRSRSPQHELEDFLYRWMTSTVKRRGLTGPIWSCKELLEQASELQALTDAGSDFKPDHEWLLDFIKQFRLKNYITDYSGDNVKRSNQSTKTFDSPRTSNIQPKKQGNFRQPPSHKIPKEPVAEYTIVETPLDSVDIKLEPVEPEVSKPVMEELDTETAMNREIKSLEKFREQQQVIEEANKQKKALLSRTLTERKQRAKKEAHKLEHIQKELSRLDNLLTQDVQVIRVKIEDASREFLDAQKRFEKAETEYIQAKMLLHNKTELKEQLTEHLYTIIHQNEVRKAKKLADLMKELEMENGENDDLELPELPPLTTFQPPHMLLSPTGSKPLPVLNKFKIVEDSVIPVVEKYSPNVEDEQKLCDKKSEMITIEPSSVRSLQDVTGDGKDKLKECDKISDNSEGDGAGYSDTFSVNNTAVKPDGTRAENDEIDHLSVSHDSVTMDTTKSSEVNKTGDNCSKSEPSSESSVNEHKQSGDKNMNTSKNAQENVKVKTKWEFDGSLS